MNNDIKPVDFKFGEYMSQGYELYRANFGKVLLATFFLFVMSLIPFCSYLAQGNFLKFLKRLKNGQNPEASEIFNFDDFMPYFKLFLIVFAGIVLLELPILIPIITADAQGAPPQMPYYFPIYMLVLLAGMFYIFARGFYIPGLISLRNVSSVREAWRISKGMTLGNVLMILAFMFVCAILSQLGVIACFVGIFVTLPFYYTAQFLAEEDGLDQQFGNEEAGYIRRF